MNKKILDILEFDKVKQLFEPYLQTEQGEMELSALTPTDKKESIETAFMELEDKLCQKEVQNSHLAHQW